MYLRAILGTSFDRLSRPVYYRKPLFKIIKTEPVAEIRLIRIILQYRFNTDDISEPST